MEKDNQSEQQVWQRVFAQPEVRRDSLRPLILSALEGAAAYRQLANILTGAGRERAGRLYQEAQATVHCLQGMERLSGNAAQPLKPIRPPQEPAAKLLARSYFRAKRAMTEYTARSLDGDFGVVFQQLAQQEGEHCRTIAELLGGK